LIAASEVKNEKQDELTKQEDGNQNGTQQQKQGSF
jgi:hypothetical protein